MNKMKNSIILKLASYMTKDVQEDLMGDRQYGFNYLTGELAELKDAILAMDKENIKEEIDDSAYAAQMILHQRTGLNFPLLLGRNSVDKFRNRNNKWKSMFEQMNIPYERKYLSGGSNFAKPQKIRSAFALAGKDLSDEELDNLYNFANDIN